MKRRNDSAQKWAVIVNEFGQVGIDGDLLPAGVTKQVELPGGCICCALDEDLEKTLMKLVGEKPDLEMILVETTGIAEPLPISWTLAKEPLAKKVQLTAVVTVIDSTQFVEQRRLSPGVDNQVEYADVLVLSKLDLLEKRMLSRECTAAIDELNQAAPRIEKDDQTVADVLWDILTGPNIHKTRIEPENTPQTHEHGFKSVSVEIADVLDWDELEEQLEALPAHYIRVKGIARVVDGSSGSKDVTNMAFHRVGQRVSREPAKDTTTYRVVAIGENVVEDDLIACVERSILR